MSANPIDALKDDLRRLQRRRKRILTLRQGSLALALILALWLVLGWLEMTVQFSLAGRTTLFCLLWLGVIAIGMWWWSGSRRIDVNTRRMAHYVEDHIPELEQRLITSMEVDDTDQTGWSSQLVTTLWADTHAQLQARDMGQVISLRTVCPAAGAALLLTGCLLLALWHWSDFLHASQRMIMPWTQTAAKMALPVKLTVAPGDINLPRGSDVMLVVTLENVVPGKVELNMQTGGERRRVAMTREGNPHTYVYVLAAVQQDMLYDVDIGVACSPQYRIAVFDRPRIEQMTVAYAYPPYTGMPDKTVQDQGDVIAPEGTRITWHTTFNIPVDRATLRFDDGTMVALDTNGTSATGSFVVTKDATYTLEWVDREQMVHEHPYAYVVRAIPDRPPVLRPIMPGGDRRVMALEEVSIAATARDDYGLQKFVLHYSIAAGETRQVALLPARQQQMDITVTGKTVLYLEDFGVQPGDVITYYLSAVDNNAIRGPAESISDIYFLEVRSTTEEFRRAPQTGGGGGGAGGGGGGPSSALIENQKQIIAATWKLLQQQKGVGPPTFMEQVTVILDAQRDVMQRTQLSLRRLLERVSFSDASYDRAVEQLKQAVAQMTAATDKLTARKLQEALVPERLALQNMMKAQAESRRTMIEIARNRGAAGAGRDMQREREDLRELFEMEMGRLENRYELPPTGGPQQDTETADTLEKLRQLASRQERMNRRQRDFARRYEQMTEGQKKRRLEELRREQEALHRQAQELSRRMSRLARQEGLRQWSDRQHQLAQAARRMQDAVRSLQQSEPASAAAEGQMALDQLRDQEREMSRQALDPKRPASQQQTAQAAAEATRLRQELENLQQQIETLRQGNRQQQRGLAQREVRADPQQRAAGVERDGTLDRLRQSLQRSRQLARGLAQPWARDEAWGVDARSIVRQLTRSEIEDFLTQPDLWRGLLQPVRELEAALRAQAERTQIQEKLFSASEQEAPTPYRHQVEEYYRELSQQPRLSPPAPRQGRERTGN